MKNILYILINENNLNYKVGITNDIEKRLNKIIYEFGEIDKSNSFLYGCNNRQLINKIEFGIHAYLTNYSYNPQTLGGGSSEWFKIESLEKCRWIIELYNKELEEFKEIGNLNEYLEIPTNFEKMLKELEISKSFINNHTKAIYILDKFIANNNKKLEFKKREGFYILESSELLSINLPNLIDFEWVIIEEYLIKFDIKVFNKWKRDRTQNELRELIKTMFFNELTLSHLDSLFGKFNYSQQQ